MIEILHIPSIRAGTLFELETPIHEMFAELSNTDSAKLRWTRSQSAFAVVADDITIHDLYRAHLCFTDESDWNQSDEIFHEIAG
ncbi:MAG: hypothetical protein ACKVS6_14415 [Planctomycetota bacterium]